MDRREAIKQAALALFAAKGFHPTPTSEVAKMAGVAEGSVFYYFASKEGILQSLFEDAVTTYLNDLTEAHQKAATGLEAMEAHVDLHFRRLEDKPQEALLLIRDLPAHPSQASPRFRRVLIDKTLEIRALIRNGIERGLADGSIKVKNAERASILFHCLMMGITRLMLVSPIHLKDLHPEAKEFCRKALT